MKHNIRINGQVQELDCELGSGILDKNGREIFEGDMIAVGGLKNFIPVHVSVEICKSPQLKGQKQKDCEIVGRAW